METKTPKLGRLGKRLKILLEQKERNELLYFKYAHKADTCMIAKGQTRRAIKRLDAIEWELSALVNIAN